MTVCVTLIPEKYGRDKYGREAGDTLMSICFEPQVSILWIYPNTCFSISLRATLSVKSECTILSQKTHQQVAWKNLKIRERLENKILSR